MCIWRKGWAKHQDCDDLSRHRVHHDVAVTLSLPPIGHKSVLTHVIVWCRRGDKPLQWRHNGRDGVSNHRRLGCLFNRLFRPRSKKISKLCVTGLCAGNSPVTGEFPAQRASNAENLSIWWRHHAIPWCNDDPVYWRLYVSPGRNELILLTSYACIFTETSQLITKSKQHISDISKSLLKFHPEYWFPSRKIIRTFHKVNVKASYIFTQYLHICLILSCTF